MRTGGTGGADPARASPTRLRELRAVDACPGPDRTGAWRLPGQACRDRRYVSADLSHRIRRASGEGVGTPITPTGPWPAPSPTFGRYFPMNGEELGSASAPACGRA